MLDPATLSILVLLALFGAAMWDRVNLGLLCFPAAFLVAATDGIGPDEVTAFFPSAFVVLVLGVTSLFAVAQINGTLPWLLDKALGLVAGRLALIPWLTFCLGALIAGLGTLPAAATAMMAPIAMGFAVRYGFPYLLMLLAAGAGIIVGCFSPIAVYALTAVNLYHDGGVETPPATNAIIFAAAIALGLFFMLVFTLVARRRQAGRAEAADADGSGVTTPSDGPAAGPRPAGDQDFAAPGGGGGSGVGTAVLTAPARTNVAAVPAGRTRDRLLTLGALAVLLVAAVGFDVDLGYLAFTLAVVLQLTLGIAPKRIVDAIPWNVVVLIAGILTYIGVLEATGGLDRISSMISVGNDPVIGLLLLCYMVGITSFFASSIAVLATAIPLVTPLVDAGLNPVGALLAVALSSLLVDVNPLGITGGLYLAATPEEGRARLFRQLLLFGIASVVVAPVLVWGLFGWF